MKVGKLYPLAILAVLTFTTYCRAILNGFVADDRIYLLGIDIYKQFDVVKIFTTLANGIEYLPFRDLTLAIDFAMFGENAAWMHFSNLFYFFLTVYAVYFLTLEIACFLRAEETDDNRRLSFLSLFSASLFAVHPINGEAVNCISSRNVILGGLFFSLSALFYLKSANSGEKWRRYYFLALFCFLLALMSKATVIILPAVLFSVTTLFSENRKRHAALLIPFFALSGVFFFIFTEVGKHAKIISQNASEIVASGIIGKTSVASQIPYFYIGKFLFPDRFTTHYDVNFSREFVSLPVLVAIFGIFAFISLAFACRRKLPEVTLGTVWFLVSLLPVLNFYATYPVVTDRYAFIPMYGLVILVSALMIWLGSACGIKVRNVAALAIVALLAGISFYRVGYWKDEKSIWGVTVKNSPEHIAGYVGLGAAYFNEGNYGKALEYYSKTRNLKPPNVMYEIALGQYYIINGQLDEAIKTYSQALERKPDSITALYALGEIYLDRGDVERARGYFLKVFDSREENYKLVAKTEKKLKSMTGGAQAGIDALRNSLEREPGNLALRGELALKYDGMGLYDEALNHYLEMERQGMDKWQLQYNIGNAYKKKKMLPEAANYFRRSLKANPENPDALNNLGVLCREMKEYREAIASFEKVISVKPLFAFAPLNLALTYRQMGDAKNASIFFEYTKKKFPEISATVDNYMKE
jgi:tetratricopeptide (TPR) repeat protein